MNAKLILFLSFFAAVTLTTSAVSADQRGGHGGGHFASMPARGGQTFTRSGAGNFRTFNDRREDRLENRRFFRNRFVSNRFVFVDSFGFPFWGWGWGWDYPYGYYGGYGYGYPYGYGYGDQGYGYGDQGYGNGDQGYGNGDRYRGGSSVAQLQRRLASAGYYHGSIDGIMGPETRRAIRAYERSQNQREYGAIDRY